MDLERDEKRYGRHWAARRLLSEFRGNYPKVAAVFVLGLIISAIQPASVKISQSIIDELQKGLVQKAFRLLPFGLVFLFALSGLAKYFHNTIRRVLTEGVVLRLRAELFQKFLNLPLSTLDQSRSGEMLSTLQNDLSVISNGLDTVSIALKEPFTFLGLIGVAFYCDWRLTLCTLVVAPLVAYLFSRSGSAVKRYSHRNLEQYSDLVSLTQESISGARVIKVFQLESVLKEKFRRVQERFFVTISKSIRVQELNTPLVEFIGAMLMAFVLLFGASLVAKGELTAGGLVAFIIAIGLAQMPIKQLNNAFLKLKTAEAAAERVYKMLDSSGTLSVEGPCEKRVRKHEMHEGIQFENVSLSYSGKPALRDISFSVRVGECVAFVGQSGSGKSSLINLLPRLYEISSGIIKIDGIDIRDIYLSDLRSLMSFVTQDTFLFNDSILENIRFGRPGATDGEVNRAAELAYCSDFIARCKDGISTRIGDRGMCLSGGERQRIAIARAILKSAPILVLDEATSSLDGHSEAIVQKALEELMRGKTTFLVAHRLSTVVRASKIYVVEEGALVEEGTHDDLVQAKGIYSGMVSRQAMSVETMLN